MRALAVGRRGCGKTNRLRCAARALLEQDPGLTCVYWDVAKPTVQYPGLVVLTVADLPRAAADYTKRTNGAPREIVVRRDTAENTAAFALRLPRAVLVIDELLHRDCLGRSKELPAHSALGDILYYGTTVDLLCTTQRLSKIPTDLSSLADVLWLYRTTSDYDLWRLQREQVPDETLAQLPTLPRFVYLTHYLE